MLLKDISFQNPEENILYDEVLLSMAEQGQAGETMRFWESPEMFVVLGRTGQEQEDVNIHEVRQDHIPVLRRASGGGTVLQGKGCFNYSLVLSKENNANISDLHKSYQMILGQIIAALKRLHVDAVFCPISDIALAGNNKKISGNAQKRSRKFILHHGTILYDFDLEKIERYLKIPKDIPEYRRERSHLDFVTNIAVTAADIKEALKHVFVIEREKNDLSDEEEACLRSFLDEKDIRIKLSG